ncbi:putative nicotinamide N-methyltransferase [Tritrichomonas foetus]|uniref:Nicotinamide N-methyltransferase n=1 Tax=Tritrichomonas foetus TaxID=1144522 RepID=A0A1J4KII8_9EUKA|nr:putative nicotinamide N-methyltransferase [Tritrichomonas foetus]|eukprot:OHT10874.1 putative nicotinamide N-methyltransferase [Tritrichomonas foetus]
MDFQELFDQGPEEEEPEPEYPVVTWEGISVRLLNRHHSLWGDKLAEAGKITASIILHEKYGVRVEGKTICELGAGAGLPSICCCMKNAKNVVTTDYPDDYLVDNIKYNLKDYNNAHVIGFMWGKDPTPLLQLNNNEKFDILILSDVIFNHTVHRQLLQSTKDLLKDDGYALILFTHHRTHLVKEDLNFFVLAESEFPFVWEEKDTVKHPPMFNDIGNMELRTAAHVGLLTFKKNEK